ncbi:Fur family transcriptional regulator [Nitrosophilus labii]|uniref:Fur family transcriptional regulator n=1 Tax=Nitrosophilus labii TaxID=2706014 RepID=UPI0016570CBC|nr:Fur family transcriptional regulator [Nitrosophilus labii]
MTKDFSQYKEQLKEIVKSKGLKYSAQREDILKALFDSKKHLTPEEIYTEVKKINKNIGLATVYRALSFLESEGLINSISFGIDGKKYELNRGQHHDHMICLKCGKIIEFFDERLESLQEYIAQKHNFKLITHELNMYGICSNCQEES